MAIAHCNVGIEDFYGQPPEASAELLEVNDRIEELQQQAKVIGEAQDAWADLNSCLHNLGPLPPEVLEGWDRIKPWLNQQGKEVSDDLAYQEERASDQVWRW
jgi:hypothetical protein